MKPFKTLLTACLMAAILTTPAFLGQVLVIPVRAMEVRPDGYPTPSLDGYYLNNKFDYDGSPRIPGKETRVETWMNRNGDKIFLYYYKGEIYGYGHVPRYNMNNGYGLIAWKAKGVYEQKYGYDEEWDIPDRLIK